MELPNLTFLYRRNRDLNKLVHALVSESHHVGLDLAQFDEGGKGVRDDSISGACSIQTHAQARRLIFEKSGGLLPSSTTAFLAWLCQPGRL